MIGDDHTMECSGKAKHFAGRNKMAAAAMATAMAAAMATAHTNLNIVKWARKGDLHHIPAVDELHAANVQVDIVEAMVDVT